MSTWMQKETENVLCAIAGLDNEIVKIYLPDNEKKEITNYRCADTILTADIVTILMKEDIDKGTEKEKIFSMIRRSKYGATILKDYISEKAIMREVEIRSDFLSALKGVKKGTDLSMPLRFSFCQEDIKKLALLHKQNKCRRKIEDLLEDCNFHLEWGDFRNKKYEKYLREGV